ncbi:retropepsin-like aspartic protease [Myroides pelagicus]|uniref:retropepsin-like aspartic protease family protein n=1 Tax=Myroides pelagicus TaxID=270914 RepID=UPI002DBDCA44|nr:retropepsin-like aspartic protease [Myroides pelagicus]MEC4114056.1 retropepsin-like aspartic protease [Myroides pelagicus]
MRKLVLIIGVFGLSLLFVDCSRCSRSGTSRARETDTRNISAYNERNFRSNHSREREIIKLHKRGGVYEVPARINGVEMTFIFDTGASNVSISLTEALYLYKQGKLVEDDFIGITQYQIADGSIGEGTVINLREVQIGNRRISNVQASIVHNMEAPLLLGQSALEQFGNFSINYKKRALIFE